MVLTLLGSMMLWVFFPGVNMAVIADNDYMRNLVIVNTIASLVGSTIGCFIVTALHGRGILI